MATFASSEFVSPSTGNKFFYLTAGPSDGPLMILLHGWPGIALTWKYQLECFASLGFYVVAPDMPGYGKTWTSTNPADFALETLTPQFIELLHHLGRKKAIWFGHDWGCGPLWAIASHYPEVCEAVIGMSVPYRTLELGLNSLLSTIDRELYPKSEYPYGQWDYLMYYEKRPEAAGWQFGSDIPKFLKLFFRKGSEETGKGIARTSEVSKNGGWFGGSMSQAPDLAMTQTTVDRDLLFELDKGLRKNGFDGPTSWYLNHASNEKYGNEGVANNGVLDMPVLFIHTEYDAVCQTVHNPRLMKEMREHCGYLYECVIKTGHWGMLERPTETNAGVVEWLAKAVRWSYPGPLVEMQL